MKKLSFMLIVTTILLNTAMIGVTMADSPEKKLNSIIEDIPSEWWRGGWDKLEELQAFIAKYPDKDVLCARAQYYIGCYYNSKKEYQKAIEAYKAVLTKYPSVASECCNAQYEIAQVTLLCLNKPKDAIAENRKAISNYPNEWVAPVAQLMIGRAYLRLNEKTQAKAELQKLIDNYPLAKRQQTESYVELGDISMLEGANKEALSYYKKAYLACPIEEPKLMQSIIDKIYQGLRNLDTSMAKAIQFIKYQKYGPAGEDRILGTSDDLTDMLAEF